MGSLAELLALLAAGASNRAFALLTAVAVLAAIAVLALWVL